MITRKLERAVQVGVPFQGVFFLGDGFPMALPWAGREVPLTGRQIVNHPETSDKWYESWYDSAKTAQRAPARYSGCGPIRSKGIRSNPSFQAGESFPSVKRPASSQSGSATREWASAPCSHPAPCEANLRRRTSERQRLRRPALPLPVGCQLPFLVTRALPSPHARAHR